MVIKNLRMYIHTFTLTFTYIQTYIYMHTYIGIYIHIHMYKYGDSDRSDGKISYKSEQGKQGTGVLIPAGIKISSLHRIHANSELHLSVQEDKAARACS